MNEFWEIVKTWEPMCQVIFFLLVLAGAAVLMNRLGFYIGVVVRGWPPEHVDVQDLWEDQ